jgi:DNA-binding beta-propeller fold protein YncE
MLATRSSSRLLVSLSFITVSFLVLSGQASAISVSVPAKCTLAASVNGQPGYDPITNMTYAPLYRSSPLISMVSVIDIGTCLGSAISFGSGSIPSAALYDPANGHIYVADFGLDRVYVVNGTSTIKTLSGGWFNGPSSLTYDSAAKSVLVANSKGNNVTVVKGNKIVGAFGTGSDPTGVVYDSKIRGLITANSGSSNLTVVANAAIPLGSLESSISLGGRAAEGIAFDPANGLDYAFLVSTSFAAAGVVVALNGNGSQVANISVGHVPTAISYSPSSKRIYIGVARSSVWEISGTGVARQVSLGGGNEPFGMVFDSASKQVLVGCLGVHAGYVFSLS